MKTVTEISRSSTRATFIAVVVYGTVSRSAPLLNSKSTTPSSVSRVGMRCHSANQPATASDEKERVKRTSLNPFTDPACKISGLNDALRFGENPFTCQEEEKKRGKNGFRFQISKFNWVFSCHIMTVKGLKVSSVIHARIKARVSARINVGIK